MQVNQRDEHMQVGATEQRTPKFGMKYFHLNQFTCE